MSSLITTERTLSAALPNGVSIPLTINTAGLTSIRDFCWSSQDNFSTDIRGYIQLVHLISTGRYAIPGHHHFACLATFNIRPSPTNPQSQLYGLILSYV